MLEKYGLSNYENKVYMKLIELGQEDARTISKLSEVPLGRIYDVMDTLVNLKLVIQSSGRPKNYHAVEPEGAINTLIKKQKEQIALLEKSSTNEINELSRIYNSQPRDKLVWKIAIGDDIQDTYLQFVDEVSVEFLTYVDISTHYEAVKDELPEIKQVLSYLDSKGISIRIIVGMESIDEKNKNRKKELDLISEFGSYNIRVADVRYYPFTVLDGQKVLLKVNHPSKPSEMLAALYFDEGKLSASLKEEFEKIWEISHPVELQLGIAPV